jgi:hypothetical protein
MQPG